MKKFYLPLNLQLFADGDNEDNDDDDQQQPPAKKKKKGGDEQWAQKLSNQMDELLTLLKPTDSSGAQVIPKTEPPKTEDQQPQQEEHQQEEMQKSPSLLQQLANFLK